MWGTTQVFFFFFWGDSHFFQQGGTLIGTQRSQSFRQLEGRRKAAHNLIIHGINALVVCGGDGSLTGADKLRAEWPEHVKALLASSACISHLYFLTHCQRVYISSKPKLPVHTDSLFFWPVLSFQMKSAQRKPRTMTS
jgi:6-phosphofructokinase